MRTVKIVGLALCLWSSGCNSSSTVDNGSKSDWVKCDTSHDCGDGKTCVAHRCEQPEAEPEPEPSGKSESGPMPNPGGQAEPDGGAGSVDGEPLDAPQMVVDPQPSSGSAYGYGLSGGGVVGPAPAVVGSAGPVDAGADAAAPSEGQDVPDAASADGGQAETRCDADAGSCETYAAAVCLVDQNSGMTDTCDSRASCTQDVETNGVVQTRSGFLSIECQRQVGSSFLCHCTGGLTAETVAVMTPQAWDACGLALSSCAERLKL
jgi:hypothetical protein